MYKNKLLACLLGIFMIFTGNASAENSQDFGDFVVHFNALRTDILPPAVTKQYNIKRSQNHGMMNIAILRKVMGTTGTPVAAEVSAQATNLAGQKRIIALREVRETNSIYYIGDFPINNDETLRFLVNVKPDGEQESYEVRFKQQFFTR